MARLRVALFSASPLDPGIQVALDAALRAQGLQDRVQWILPAQSGAPPDAGIQDHDLVALMGFEPPEQAPQHADGAIRRTLEQSGVPYQVLYGTPVERLEQLLELVGRRLGSHGTDSQAEDGAGRPWVWVCDKCSDPACEHQLLTGLLARRAAPPTGP